VDEALKALDGRFNEIYGEDGRRAESPEGDYSTVKEMQRMRRDLLADATHGKLLELFSAETASASVARSAISPSAPTA